ncbi:MAG: hypothetical protein HKN34_00945 [Gammaproteobacteria bacterium]|nr:hypothetical protein [Gammaproteobacteria bacterium]
MAPVMQRHSTDVDETYYASTDVMTNFRFTRCWHELGDSGGLGTASWANRAIKRVDRGGVTGARQ